MHIRSGKSKDNASFAEELYMEFEKEDSLMTMDDMADTFINLLFAGHDTTAHTIARMLAELPRHPDVWDRLVKEQAAVIPLSDEHNSAVHVWLICTPAPTRPLTCHISIVHGTIAHSMAWTLVGLSRLAVRQPDGFRCQSVYAGGG